MMKVTLEAPAKLNLALDITGVLDNGYHQVDMIMQSVSLMERVEVIKSTGWALRCPGSRVPANEKNTATKAAAAFFRETGLLAGAEVTIHKSVPTRAGMGGGSADAAAVLVGLNELYRACLSVDELCEIGALVGADVPFSILGSTARATGFGEALAPLPPLPACWFAVAMPPGGVSTPLAYERYDQMGSPVHPDMEAAVAALHTGSLNALLPHMQNALEHANGDAVTRALRRCFDECGALASMMTGSGAAVFGLFDSRQAAQSATEAARSHAKKVYLLQPVNHGPVIKEAF